jgi:hypothetical protein
MNFKAGLFTAMGVPVSGAVDLTLRVQRDADYWFLDWNDGIFYAPAHVFVAIGVAMAEPDNVHAPGWYMYNIPDATLGTWNAGIYTMYMLNAGALAPPPWQDIAEIRLPDALGTPVIIPAIANAILDADLQLHLGAGVGFRNIGNILGQLAQSEFEQRTNVFAAGAVVAQGITAPMAAMGCIQYQTVVMSYTKNFAAPDRTYYLLYHYNAQRQNDIVKASLLPVW